RMPAVCRTRATEPGWLRFCQRQQRRSRSGVGQVQRSVRVSTCRIKMTDWDQTSTVPLTRRLIRPGSVITVWCWIVLAATTAMAQQSAGTVTESVTTRPDLNGRDAVSEKVVTQRDRTKDEERVVIETYAPLIYADRLELNRRVRRVITVTPDGSQTI